LRSFWSGLTLLALRTGRALLALRSFWSGLTLLALRTGRALLALRSFWSGLTLLALRTRCARLALRSLLSGRTPLAAVLSFVVMRPVLAAKEEPEPRAAGRAPDSVATRR
ncbi:hypothetical protein ACFU6I_11480, partial [Streptomyces sp. NPDC057486]|uniref:hypothetical protein n=1 Tax=Streptomyces sp. NPDC057486 TaxID=3346145 RepID=UPI0036A8198D